MVDHYYFYIIGAFISSFVLQYLVIDLSLKRGIFIDDHEADLPQKFHKTPTPRIGGLGIFIGCFFLMSNIEVGLFIMLASVPAFVSGLLEDLFAKISPGRRLIIMAVSAIMAIYLLSAVVTDFGFFVIPVEIGIFVTLVAILGMINGTNLIDGINGLSSGISLIIFLTYYFISRKLDDANLEFINAICAASIAGFILFNYPKGRIFLGDGGAYFTGFILAVISILIIKYHPGEISPWFAFCCLIHPVWEVMFSFFRKAVFDKESPFKPDSYHIHQFIFIYIVNKNNPLTTLVILPFVIITNLLAIVYYDNSIALAIISFSYITLYTTTYLILYSKHKKQVLMGNPSMTKKDGLVDKSPNEAEAQ